jgi:transcriptional regulator with PAS, ATPase and Fis domain
MVDNSIEGLFGSRGRLVGRIVHGPGLAEAVESMTLAAAAMLPVLVTGESGVGKELVADAIHSLSVRHDRPFVPINCAGLSKELVESELFGHVKGAFTSASISRPGAFVAAHGGTLLLDEIGELPMSTQASLLRVLESGKVRPVGSEVERAVDVRIIAATHRDLDLMAAAGTFRADLVFRLDVLRVHVPPLRDRTSDIRLLVPALLERHGFRTRVTRQALEALERHPWPGNVRELRNVIIRAAQAGGSVIERAHIDAALGRSRYTAPHTSTLRGSMNAYAAEVLASTGNSAPRAARSLGVPRSTFYRWLKSGQLRAATCEE